MIYYDRTTKDLSELEIGQLVRIRATTAQGKKWTYGTCVDIKKRSYSVEINNRQYRRNLREFRMQRNLECHSQNMFWQIHHHRTYRKIRSERPTYENSVSAKTQWSTSNPRSRSREHILPREIYDYVMWTIVAKCYCVVSNAWWFIFSSSFISKVRNTQAWIIHVLMCLQCYHFINVCMWIWLSFKWFNFIGREMLRCALVYDVIRCCVYI